MPRPYGKSRLIVAPAAGEIGTPYGSFESWSQTTTSATLKSGTAIFSLSQDSTIPSRLKAAIDAAGAIGTGLIPMLTGGGHERYINKTVGAGTSVSPWLWDIEYWKHGNPETVSGGGLLWPDGTGMDRYNTPQIVDWVNAAFEQKIIRGFDIQDEPQASNWRIPSGPSGITRQNIDAMAAYMKGIFGAHIPVGISCRTDYFNGAGDSGYVYNTLDFMTTQYIQNFGDCATWRDLRLSQGIGTHGLRIIFSENVLNGGAGFGEDATSCATVSPPDNLPTGGWRSGTDRCYMGQEQMEVFGATLMAADSFGRKGSAFIQWTYESAFYGRPSSQAAFAVNRSMCDLRTVPSPSLHR